MDGIQEKIEVIGLTLVRGRETLINGCKHPGHRLHRRYGALLPMRRRFLPRWPMPRLSLLCRTYRASPAGTHYCPAT